MRIPYALWGRELRAGPGRRQCACPARTPGQSSTLLASEYAPWHRELGDKRRAYQRRSQFVITGRLRKQRLENGCQSRLEPAELITRVFRELSTKQEDWVLAGLQPKLSGVTAVGRPRCQQPRFGGQNSMEKRLSQAMPIGKCASRHSPRTSHCDFKYPFHFVFLHVLRCRISGTSIILPF